MTVPEGRLVQVLLDDIANLALVELLRDLLLIVVKNVNISTTCVEFLSIILLLLAQILFILLLVLLCIGIDTLLHLLKVV